ncbi:ABC transporter permease [Desulfosporosinus youngiae]|uniref:ABC-type dipeptide/oligopeptide/nickel transport system, permease component n=1 Tax=Desulfosporosinus youngiae DSM 17734 TaxID=768710 RepID=H5Y453_9FIRM|nr:ABC transporter permease [Desulfosporosinus youngiae]EHQ89734.1 ABC-type dipeptide/oligopeptide/nickel transport system, permease component [Desulfosporosinus youngiae DSM 17734]
MRKGYLLVLLIIITINFFLPRLMPGDPFLYLSVEDGNVSSTFSEEQIVQYKTYYGLDKPLAAQYLSYLAKLARGDLGYSIYFNTSVLGIITSRVPWTIFIVLTSLLLSSLIGVSAGVVSAWLRGKPADTLLYSGMILLSEIPAFLLGVLLLFIFAAKLRWFPLSGGVSPFLSFSSNFDYLKDLLNHAALPVITLTLTRLGGFYLLSRNSMLTVIAKNFMTTARAKGLKKSRILFRHALRNALPPIITRIFMSLGTLFGGAVLIENVFNYPGIGRLMREAVVVRDYVLIEGIFLFITVTVLLMNFLADAVHKKFDPRV